MKKLASVLLPFLGFLFLTAYIRSATVDVVYTDYIRIVNTYLPNALSFKPYLQGDILTRVPISYLERIISTYIFRYSTTFDMIMGAAGLTLTAIVLAKYMNRKKLSLGAVFAVLFVVFALDKWEMLTNGTGWMHFWTFALFYAHYDIYDRIRGDGAQLTTQSVGAATQAGMQTTGAATQAGIQSAGAAAQAGMQTNTQQTGSGTQGACGNDRLHREEMALRILPFVTILLFAGPYCVIYAGAMGIVYVMDYFMKNYDAAKTKKKDWILRIVCLGIPFILFCISKYLSVDEYAGATDETLLQVIKGDPTLLPKMVLKSFASMVIGGETAMEYGVSNKVLYLMGIFVIASYAYAIYINIKKGIYKKNAFPMLLIISGLISHAIVVWGRWIFKSPDYMMSSRYALQFQSGIIGIMLTFFLERQSCAALKADSTVQKAQTVKNAQIEKTAEMANAGSAKPADGKIANASTADAETVIAKPADASTADAKIEDTKTTVVADRGILRKVICIVFMVVILVGHLVTTGREINMAQYRKAAFENVRETALNYENESDDTLKGVLQYSKPDKTRQALKILQDAQLNVFK